MSRSQRRLDRIKNIPLAHVLHHLGYDVSENYQREQQFSCDLHGDGSDSKPSARLYNDEVGKESWFCFACGKARDAVATYRDKYGLSFRDALSRIEKDFNLPSMGWEEPEQNFRDILKNQDYKDFDKELKSLESVLFFMTQDKSATLQETVNFWEAFDKVVYMTRAGLVDETQGRALIQQIREKVYECFFRG